MNPLVTCTPKAESEKGATQKKNIKRSNESNNNVNNLNQKKNTRKTIVGNKTLNDSELSDI